LSHQENRNCGEDGEDREGEAAKEMKLKSLGAALSLALCGCAYGPPVTTEVDAIARGMKACAEVDKDMPTSGWRAILQGDQWRVWQGEGNGNGPKIDVPRSGKAISGYSDCHFIDVRF
jgi:hypothetical protein